MAGGSFASIFDIQVAVACALTSGAPSGGAYIPGTSILVTIACATGNANQGALSEVDLLYAIACNTAQSPPVGGYYTYNKIGLLNQISCNVGGPYAGDSEWLLWESIYCGIAGGPTPPSTLFHFSAGDRPAGSLFSRAGAAFELSNSAPPTSSPRWYTVTNPQGILFAVGDSVTLGATAIESYFPKIQRLYAPTKRLHNSNLGVNSAYLSNSGSAATDMDVTIGAYVDPVFTTMKGAAIVFGGSNDAFLGGASAATVFTRLKADCNLIRVSHPNVKIVVVTLLPRQNNGSFETLRQTLRTSMLGGDSSYDYVADWGGNVTMAANAASSTNATYYSDQIHPTDAGQIIGASIIGPVVATALTAAGL